ncbi:MAG TPA: M14 family zinc carboxypeptidase [Solirubrobacteraceae bacterium]|nr:M14 family zinc carboxypeptidase [Solirubrobacteraceae bacterium]
MSAPARPRPERGTFVCEPARFGESGQGRPLEVWRGREDRGVLVVAGLHGEEPETVVTLSSALRSLDAPDLAASVVLTANPDGLARGTRGNAAGIDLNRNFPTADWTAQPPPGTASRAPTPRTCASPPARRPPPRQRPRR